MGERKACFRLLGEYGAIRHEGGPPQLSYPFSAFRSDDGHTVIGDAFNGRIVVVDGHGKHVRTLANYPGFPNWFPRWVVPLGHGAVLFVDRNSRQVGIVSEAGLERVSQVDLEPPLFAAPTPHGSILVGGRAGRSARPLIELDMGLEQIGGYLDGSYSLQSAEMVDGEHILLCDIGRHQVLICDRRGRVTWSFGRSGFPGENEDELSSPKYAHLHADTVFIADGMNNRVLCVALDGSIRRAIRRVGGCRLWWPVCVQTTRGGNLLITDAGNNRVVEVDAQGEQVWCYGHPVIRDFALWSPRLIEPLAEGGFLVSDTYHHRILRLGPGLRPRLLYGGRRGSDEGQLFWPRCARRTGKTTYAIADARNRRIVEIDGRRRRAIRQLACWRYSGTVDEFLDPHDLELTPDGGLIVTDARLGRVICTDWEGNARWVYGLDGELDDPHQGRLLGGDQVLICDTGHNRVLRVLPSGKVAWQLDHCEAGRFSRPRWCEPLADGRLLLADSDNNRLLLMTTDGAVHGSFGLGWRLDEQSVRAPRCVRQSQGRFLVSDTFNNRVLILGLEDGQDRHSAGIA